jgi:hypothetical protein
MGQEQTAAGCGRGLMSQEQSSFAMALLMLNE